MALTDHDRDQVAQFAEFLRNAGPPGGPLTEAQREWRRKAAVDPGWAQWLGLPPTVEGGDG